MPWDKVGGMCYTAKGKGSLYGVSVFDIKEGGEVVLSRPDGSIIDINQHTGEGSNPPQLAAKVAVLVKWTDTGGTIIEGSKLYLDCDSSQEGMWKRMFISFAALGPQPQNDGLVSISIRALGAETFVKVGPRGGGGAFGTLVFNTGMGSSQLPPPGTVLRLGPGYREVATLQDCSQSNWADGPLHFDGEGWGTIGAFDWYAPAARPVDTPPAGPNP